MDTPLTYAVDVLGPIVGMQDRPLWHHTAGLQQTSSGYGRKLASTRVVQFANVKGWRRVYVCCYSNSGTAYVQTKEFDFLVVCDTDLPTD